MKAREVLSLWGARWDKASQDGRAPFLTGRPYQWGQQLSDWGGWEKRGVSALSLLVALLIAAWVVTLRFSVGAQLGFLLTVLMVAAMAVRYQGRLMGLLILVLSAVMTARYFYWRLGQTVPLYPVADFLMSLGLFLAEGFFWSWFALAALEYILRDRQAQAFSLPDWVTSAREMMATYRPVAMGFLCIAPMFFVLAGVRTLPTQLTGLLLMGAPHWILMYLTAQRTAAPGRPNLWQEAQTILRAMAVLVRTAVSWLRTGFARGNRGVAFAAFQEETHAAPWRTATWLMAWLCVGLGSLGLMRTHSAPQLTTLIYIAWCALVGLSLTADYAIAAERRSVLALHQQLARLPTMILQSSGHALPGQTRNFPASELVVQMATVGQFKNGDGVGVSVFHGNQEFHFPASVVHTTQESLTVVIDEDARARVQAAVQYMRVRGENWPRWLPGPHADRLVPNWLIQPLMHSFSTVSLQVAQNGVGKTFQHFFSQLINRKPT